MRSDLVHHLRGRDQRDRRLRNDSSVSARVAAVMQLTSAPAPSPPTNTFGRVVDRTVGRLVAPTFGLLTRLRGARVFHPHGRAYATEIDVGPTAPIAPGRYQGIVRLSRGLGLPEPWPDVLGLAVRMLNADGLGGIQDLLLVSSLPAVCGRHLILPGRGYGGVFYSSVLPVRTGGRAMIVGAGPVWTGDPQPLARLAEIDRAVGSALRGFELLLAGPLGAWSHLAQVGLTRALPEQDSEAVRFDPYHQAAGLAPVGVLNALRRRSYGASQRARQYGDAPRPAFRSDGHMSEVGRV
jgi:hypothetical protein